MPAPRRPTMLAALSLAGLGLAAGGCQPLDAEPPRLLHHRLTRPENAQGVFLNEELVFHFSAELDQASVTRESVRIVSSSGRPARGSLIVEGSRLRFVPAPVLARDLSDGGYEPGTAYQVEISGFPRPDGLRGTSGEPLRATYRFEFRTVEAGSRRDGLVFEDRDPGRTRLLRFSLPPGPGARVVLDPRGALYLKCDKPLDPATIHDGAFELRSRRAAPAPAPIQLRARLVENEPVPRLRPRPPLLRLEAGAAGAAREPRAALIELLPVRRPGFDADVREAALWKLVLRGDAVVPGVRLLHCGPAWPPIPLAVPHVLDLRPRDVGGNVVWDPALQRVDVRLVDRGPDALRGALIVDFLDARDAQLRSPVAVPGADGTAWWGHSGRVEVRLPRAAGEGWDGDVSLAGREDRRDVQSVRIDVPPGATCELSPAPGPVVLRTQGALVVRGRLARATGQLVPMRFEGRTLTRWLDAALALDAAHAAREADWTVLLAGGDLVIEGVVDVSTPLLLCAGGRIRVTGSVRAGRADQLFRLGEGGGEGLSASNVTELEIDPPERNALREPLRFAVLSGPIPPQGEVVEWLEAQARGSAREHGGPAATSGSWSVRYVREIPGGVFGPDPPRAADDPRLFEPAGSIQLWIELTVEPGPRWRPPFVDDVRLAWREADPQAWEAPR